jgi:hypothetical protein
MQAAQLYHDKGQEKPPGKIGIAQVLQVLPNAHPASRDEVARKTENERPPQAAAEIQFRAGL